MQKKENSKFKDEIKEFKDVVNNKNNDEEQIDINYSNDDAIHKDLPPQSKLMQIRMNS